MPCCISVSFQGPIRKDAHHVHLLLLPLFFEKKLDKPSLGFVCLDARDSQLEVALFIFSLFEMACHKFRGNMGLADASIPFENLLILSKILPIFEAEKSSTTSKDF